MNELEQQWRSNQFCRIVLENIGIKQPSFRIWYLTPDVTSLKTGHCSSTVHVRLLRFWEDDLGWRF
ncbi:unnamed protein product [Brassica rapa subsp. narinosa]